MKYVPGIKVNPTGTWCVPAAATRNGVGANQFSSAVTRRLITAAFRDSELGSSPNRWR